MSKGQELKPRSFINEMRAFARNKTVPSISQALETTGIALPSGLSAELEQFLSSTQIHKDINFAKLISGHMNPHNGISWCTHTTNFCKGCTECGRLCQNCWARDVAELRLYLNPQAKDYWDGFRTSMLTHKLLAPFTEKNPCMIFGPSVGDLGHTELQKPYRLPLTSEILPGGKIESDYLTVVLTMIYQAYWHKFMLLTKRPHNLLRYRNRFRIPPNLWLGVSPSGPADLRMIRALKQLEATVLFLSMEPLLCDFAELESELEGFHMLIVGGESYSSRVPAEFEEKRQMKVEWALGIKEMCQRKNIAFHFKQWGGNSNKSLEPLLPDIPLADYLKRRREPRYAKLSEVNMIKTMLKEKQEWNMKKFFGYPESGLEIMRFWKPEDYA